MSPHLRLRRAVDGQVLAVIGEGDILIAGSDGGLDHLLEGGPPVTGAI